jgi:hypothetical protein
MAQQTFKIDVDVAAIRAFIDSMPEDPEERRKWKMRNFGLLYGTGVEAMRSYPYHTVGGDAHGNIISQVITTTGEEPSQREDTRSILERKVAIVPCEDWVKIVDAQIKEFIDADKSYDQEGRQAAVKKTIHEMNINEGDFDRWVEAARKKPPVSQ